MEQTLENDDFGLKYENVKILRKNTANVIKSNKCNQCEYASSDAGNLGRHLKMHSGEKPSRWNQCNFASSQADVLKTQTNATNVTLDLLS